MPLKRIKRERVRGALKKPFEPRLFDRVGAVVRGYGLGREFLEELEGSERNFPAKIPGLMGRGRKRAPEPVLFSLLTGSEYRVTVGIIERLHNPYLAYANDPDEILLSEMLFRINPDLEPDMLASVHFGATIRRELAGKGSEPPRAEGGGTADFAEDRSGGESDRAELIERWIDDLEALIK